MEMQSILEKDMNTAHAEMEATEKEEGSPNQYRRRNFVRATFAYVDGALYTMRQMALETQVRFGLRTLGDYELDALMGHRVEVADNGEIKKGKLKLEGKTAIKFSFLAVYKAFGIEEKLDDKGAGWNALMAATDRRHDLVHPKGREELDVTDTDLATLYKGLVWFHTYVDIALNAYTAKLDEERAKIKRLNSDYEKLLGLQPPMSILLLERLDSLHNQSGMSLEEFNRWFVENKEAGLTALATGQFPVDGVQDVSEAF
jgi:hypothetical protein